MKKFLGHGGVGDCFIVILKLLELKDQNYVYHHLNTGKEKLLMCGELLKIFNINFKLLHCADKQRAWRSAEHNYDKCFNMYAEGKINVPPAAEALAKATTKKEIKRLKLFYGNHWEACQDAGLNKPFMSSPNDKEDYIVVQPIAGLIGERDDLKEYSRHWKNRPIIEYVRQNFPPSSVIWVGSERFDIDFGDNQCGKLTLKESFNIIQQSSHFVGYNSVLLYWALYNRVKSHLFMDFQGKTDLRIHKDWKPYLEYVE